MSNEQQTADQKLDTLSLKWGTLKTWNINSDAGLVLLARYKEIGSRASAMCQDDTEEQKEIICKLIDMCAGDTIYLEWDGIDVSKERAKEYVINYGKKK